MKIEAGKYYRLRNGHKAYCIGRVKDEDVKTDKPWIVIDIYEDFVCSYTDEGKYGRGGGHWDIVSEWREPLKVEGWVNVYKEGVRPDDIYLGKVFQEKYQADNESMAKPNRRITCIYVSGVEGEGPDE